MRMSFQYNAKDWSGQSSDTHGTCDAEYRMNGTTLNVEKKNCIKSRVENQQGFMENVLEKGNVSLELVKKMKI